MAAAAIPLIASLGSSLLGGLFGSKAQGNASDQELAFREWLKNFGISQLDKAQSQYYDPVRDNAINMLNLYGPMLSGGPIELLDKMNNQDKGIMDLFTHMSQNMPDGMSAQQNILNSLLGGAQGSSNIAAQLLAGGGWTPARQDYNDRLMDLINGVGVGQNNNILGDIGTRLLQNGGATNFTTNTQDRATGSLNSGGMNPYLDSGMAAALGITNSGGASSATQAGLPLAMQLIQGAMRSGGATQYTDAMQKRGLDLAGREALLPTELVAAMAGDEAASGFDKQRSALMARALARGGGPGNIVAAGSQTGAEADFEDERLKAITDAVRNATLGQQSLGLQQMGTGASLAGSGANAANQTLSTLLGSGGNLLTGLGGLENERLLGGLGTIASLNNSATQNMGTLGNLGLGAGQLDLSRMGLGGQLTQNNVSNLLEALKALEAGTTNQQNIALGGGSLYNNLLGTQGNLSNSIIQNILAAGNQGLNQFSTLMNAQNSSNQNISSMYNQLASLYLNGGMSPMMSMGNTFANLMSNALGQTGTPNPLGAFNVQSPWASQLPGIGQAVGGVLGGLGNKNKAGGIQPWDLPNIYG